MLPLLPHAAPAAACCTCCACCLPRLLPLPVPNARSQVPGPRSHVPSSRSRVPGRFPGPRSRVPGSQSQVIASTQKRETDWGKTIDMKVTLCCQTFVPIVFLSPIRRHCCSSQTRVSRQATFRPMGTKKVLWARRGQQIVARVKSSLIMMVNRVPLCHCAFVPCPRQNQNCKAGPSTLWHLVELHVKSDRH